MRADVARVDPRLQQFARRHWGERQEARAAGIGRTGHGQLGFRPANNYYCHEPARMDMSSSVDLGNKLEKVVANLVKSGRYNSKSEVLREGVRLVQEREARFAVLDAAIARGIAAAEAGRVKPVDEVFDRLEAKYSALVKAKR
jgi:antitoxin ParD1/3/4